jgi:hypothetical protein
MPHYYWFDSALSTLMQDATNYAIQVSIDPTDITTQFTSAGSADVRVYDQNYSNWCGITNWHPVVDANNRWVFGYSQCVSTTSLPANACEVNEVRYDESWTPTVDVWSRIALACHENGHALGMEHWSNATTSCMSVDVHGSRNSFDGADVYWINLNYP